MNAKLAETHSKTSGQIYYECEDCDIAFCLLDEVLVCPNCGSKDLTHMVIIYKENDPILENMLSDKELHAGD